MPLPEHSLFWVFGLGNVGLLPWLHKRQQYFIIMSLLFHMNNVYMCKSDISKSGVNVVQSNYYDDFTTYISLTAKGNKHNMNTACTMQSPSTVFCSHCPEFINIKERFLAIAMQTFSRIHVFKEFESSKTNNVWSLKVWGNLLPVLFFQNLSCLFL